MIYNQVYFFCLQVDGAMYKSGTGTRGRGHRDACVGTWGRETRDFGTSSMGRGEVKNRNARDAECEELWQKSEVNAISLSS